MGNQSSIFKNDTLNEILSNFHSITNVDDLQALKEKTTYTDQIVVIQSSGIFVPQNAHCPLWITCNTKTKSLKELAQEYNNDFGRILNETGFNLNFLTRDRWLDIPVLVNDLKVGMNYLKTYLNLQQKQIDSWNLSEQEFFFFNF